jgi:hypothetical protein
MQSLIQMETRQEAGSNVHGLMMMPLRKVPCTANQLSNEHVLLLHALPTATAGQPWHDQGVDRNRQCVSAPLHVFLQASSHS